MENQAAPARLRDTGVARKRLEPGARRDQLITVADTLFRERGFDRVSMTDIARAASVSHGLVYHYFSSTRALRLAKLERDAAELERTLAPDAALLPHERSWASVDAFVAAAEENPDDFMETLRADAFGDDDLTKIVRRVRESVIQSIAAQIGCELRPLLRLALLGWVGFAERTTGEWLERRPITREAFVSMLVLSLRSALADALGLEVQPLDRTWHEIIFGEGTPSYDEPQA